MAVFELMEAEGKIAKLQAENARLRAYIESLDGKTLCVRGDGDTFIDDGIVVASDIIGPNTHQ